MNQLFFLLIYLFEALIAFLYYNDNFKNKQIIVKTILIAVSLYFLGFIINIIDGNTNYINEFFFLIINIVFSKICFDISWKSSIFHASFLLCVMFLTELVAEAGTSYFLHIPIDAYKNNFSALLIIGIISKMLYLFVCKIVSYFFSYKKYTLVDYKRTAALFLYPIMITATLTTFLYASTKYSFSKGLNLVCAIISILSIVFCCFIFIFNQVMQRQQNDLINLQAINQKNELNESFYALLEQKNEDQRVLIHDIKHHLFAIDSMENISDIKSYIIRIQPEIDNYRYIGKTDNKMFDLILNKYSMIAKNENIDFGTDIRSSNLSFIDNSDLVSLMGNLLDNAFEAAKTSKSKRVLLTTAHENNFIILSIINSCSTAPVVDNDRLITTKSDKRFHGYGTKSIEKTAEKYNGICQWDFDEESQEFHYNILFNK